MANVRIGPDGTIWKDGQAVSGDSMTVIDEDGTIVSTPVGRTAAPVYRGGYYAQPPVSPLEDGNGGGEGSAVTDQAGAGTPHTGTLAEKEFDIQMMEARIRNSVPRGFIIATVILCILGLLGMYFLFIPAVITGIMAVVGFYKRSRLKAQRDVMAWELDEMRRGI